MGRTDIEDEEVTPPFTRAVAFANQLLAKYETSYFGVQAMQVGVVEFGNGKLQEAVSQGQGDPVAQICPAINIHALSSDISGAVKTALSNMPPQKGFTNMAQAFALSENMFTTHGRNGAQSAVMVITDGLPSFAFQTEELVEQLDDKGVQRFFVVVTENDKDLQLMQKWASAPWETNLLHIPGFEALIEEADRAVFTEKALTMFCPYAYSPSLGEAKEHSYGYMHVRDQGYCGARGALLSTEANDAQACAFLAQGAHAEVFLLGTWFRRGYCYAGDMTVDSAQYESWGTTRADPECPDGWTRSTIYDFYAMEPVEDES